jgi:hypothetical protein
MKDCRTGGRGERAVGGESERKRSSRGKKQNKKMSALFIVNRTVVPRKTDQI